MKKSVAVLLAAALICSSLTAFAGWKDQDLVQKIRSTGNAGTHQSQDTRAFSQRLKEAKKAQAEAAQGYRTVNRKPVIAVVYENNAKTKYNTAIDKKLFEYLNAALPASLYELADGTPYRNRLAEIGIEDIANAERSDLLQALEGSNVDYFLYLGVGSVNVRAKSSLLVAGKAATASLPFRVIDVKNNKYVYTKTYMEAAQSTTPIGSVGGKSVTLEIMTRVGQQIQTVLGARLPKTITYTESVGTEGE